MKSDYEPEQTAGINTFNYWGEVVTIIHPGAGVETLRAGQILLLRRHDNSYWCGRVYNDAFIFLLGSPVPISKEAAFEYLRSLWKMAQVHHDADFVEQGELDFR